MIAIIAEKPSVGQEIARVVGATEKKDGYITGNGYMVTWALGHLVSLALPGTYGYTRTTAEDLPMLPEPFRLVERQIRTDRGMVTDIAAGRQLKVIDGVFSECDSIIVATDAGREGELIFRWIYSHLGCTKPFKRLWFSSLTDEAIRKGMADLREGYEYDSLYAAADSRAKADWLVGMNASRALAAVSGSANNSIGRVQTPTLAMICARFKENRNFVSTPYWQLHITLKQGEAHRLFIHPEHFGDKKAAETAYGRIIPGSAVTITKVERGTVFQQAPLLYDLTSLQKDCNIHHDLTADKTLSIAQSLYEKKLVSYPRTGSRYIPEDIMANIPALLEKIIAMPLFREYGRTFDFSALNTRSVDTTKVTDHHALIITGVAPEELSEAESAVYTLIAGRMLEAFSPPCEKERLLMECMCGGMDFRSRAAIITTLFKRNYVERSGKSILPTEKGLYLYESVKDMMVADAELTGTWERALARIEGRTLDPDSFMLSIREYTGKVTGEILRLKFPEPSSHAFTCPKCKAGNVVVKSKVAKCDREGCGLLVFRRFLNKELTDRHLEQLFSSGSTRLIKGFKGKKGCSFDAALTFDDSFNLKLSFPKPKGAKGK